MTDTTPPALTAAELAQRVGYLESALQRVTEERDELRRLIAVSNNTVRLVGDTCDHIIKENKALIAERDEARARLAAVEKLVQEAGSCGELGCTTVATCDLKQAIGSSADGHKTSEGHCEDPGSPARGTPHPAGAGSAEPAPINRVRQQDCWRCKGTGQVIPAWAPCPACAASDVLAAQIRDEGKGR